MGNLDRYFNKARDLAEDVRAGREISQGLAELENLPEIEGSIIYKMELETMTNYLNSLLLIINDSRLDNGSVAEEIRKVLDKAQPAAEPQEDETDEQKAAENVKAIVYSACTRALEAIRQA